MSAETLADLIEEMIDVKIQQSRGAGLHATPEVARLLQEKQATDRKRLQQIKAKLIRELG